MPDPAPERPFPTPPGPATPSAPDLVDAGFQSYHEIERATGSPTLRGNQIKLQFDGPSTFEAWIEAIQSAKRFVYFENYVVRDDRVGRAFRDALVAKAREGVPVHVIYDWVGCWATPRRYWKPFKEAGVQVRAFNPPALALGDPLGGLQRDHRKLVAVDGVEAFIGGFCIGQEWAGTATQAPWRDTGLEIRGPAARAAALAFERLWGEMGESSLLATTIPDPPPAGDTPVWLIEGEPGKARVYRTLHVNAVRARTRIWITDAYFVAPRPITEALAAAAQQGVDVRILVPAHNNWPLVGSISRGGFRFLLESGVRLFEWQGKMIHAKTSVVDGTWCRVGSSNLNSASLIGNWEMDAGVVDRGLAEQLEGLFLADLASSREIVLPRRGRVAVPDVPGELETPKEPLDPWGTLPERLERALEEGGSRRMGMAPFVRAGSLLGAALAGNRQLGREDRTVLGTLAVGTLVLAGLAMLLPELAGWVVALVLFWFGTVMGIRAYAQARRARAEERYAALHEEQPESEK